MKSFIFKSIIYFFTITITILLFNSFFIKKRSYEYGEFADFRGRLKFLKENNSNFNTIFVGSSRVRHHIKPNVFDSICGTQSFNLGSNGMFAPATYAMAEQLLIDNSLKIDNLLLDFTFVKSISRYLGTEKSHYWITPKNYSNTIHMILNSRKNKIDKYELGKQYSIALANKLFSFGKPVFLYKHNITNISDYEVNNSGYYSLDYQLKFHPNERTQKSRFNFLKDSSGLEKQKIKNSERRVLKQNQGLKNKIDQLLSLAKDKKINLVFFLQPSTNFDEVFSDFMLTIPPNHRIDLTQNNELILAKNHFDISHLNDKGAYYFTSLLAHKFALLEKESTHN
jgi:hypothetical protein